MRHVDEETLQVIRAMLPKNSYFVLIVSTREGTGVDTNILPASTAKAFVLETGSRMTDDAADFEISPVTAEPDQGTIEAMRSKLLRNIMVSILPKEKPTAESNIATVEALCACAGTIFAAHNHIPRNGNAIEELANVAYDAMHDWMESWNKRN